VINVSAIQNKNKIKNKNPCLVTSYEVSAQSGSGLSYRPWAMCGTSRTQPYSLSYNRSIFEIKCI